MRWWRSLSVALVAVWILMLAARCHLPRQTISSSGAQDGTRAIYVVQHGWHAGVAVPTADVPEDRWPVWEVSSASKYLEVGWGEAGYYPGHSRGMWGVLRAGVWPTGSVVHVVPIDRPVPERFSERTVIRVPVGERGLEALTSFVAKSFAVDSTGHATAAAPGYYANSRFYASPLSYHVFNNCNHWAAAALEAAGCDVAPRWIFSVGQVMRQAEACGMLLQEGRR